jgi:hypothetical protein
LVEHRLPGSAKIFFVGPYACAMMGNLVLVALPINLATTVPGRRENLEATTR